MSIYAEWLARIPRSAASLRESMAAPLPDEMQLQALWFAGLMGRDFQTVDGRKVRIVQFGHWNHGAGPDFLHAAIEIDGERFSGPLELDHRVSDWEFHGHAVNESFNEVILHVVFANEGKCQFTRTSNHRQVPQIVVPDDLVREALNSPPLAVASAHPGLCSGLLEGMTEADVRSMMMEAARHRAQVKAKRQRRMVEVLGEDEWLWQALAGTLGYRPNQLPMTLLAQRLPLQDLKKAPEVAEAMIFGAAGFLSAEMYQQADGGSRDYLRSLWDGWWQIRHDYEPIPERRIPWILSGVRPVNHPQRRLGCLFRVFEKWAEFKKVYRSLDGMEDFLLGLNHDFWSHHYTLNSKWTGKKLALIGAQRIREFQINHVLPARLVEDDTVAWQQYLELPAPALSEKVEKASIRLFGARACRKSYLGKAWQHQALLQVYQDFCLRDISDCQDCPFPEQLSQWANIQQESD